MKIPAMKRRDFLKVGGGVVAGAAVGITGTNVGNNLGAGGELAAVASSRGLTGAEARAALTSVVPPGKYDPFFMFASGGHSGQISIIGIPSMRLLKIIPVFSRDSFSGYGFGTDVDGVIPRGSDPTKSNLLSWGDTHHPALSETEGRYDGRWLYVNDRANGRIGMVDLADYKTKQIYDIPNIGSAHGGVFVTPDSEYAHVSSITPRPITDNGYAPLESYADLYRGFSSWCAIDQTTGHLVPEKSFQIELPPYNQDLADMGKLASAGYGFLNSFNAELSVGMSHKNPPIEIGAAKNKYDYLHVIDWKKAEKVVAAGKIIMRNGIRVIPLQVAISEGILHFIPEPKNPHGVEVSPDGNYIVIAGKLDPAVTVYSITMIKKAIEDKNFEGTDRYGVPIIPITAVTAAHIELGAGPLHTQYDGKGNAYTSLFIDSAIIKWTLGPDAGVTEKPFTVLEKIPVHYNIGHLAIPGGDTVAPVGTYMVALNKWSLDQVQKLGPQHPVNLELFDINHTPPRVLSSLPLGGSEPHYAQIISVDRLNPLTVYPPGTSPETMAKSEFATASGQERIVRADGFVDVYATVMRSHFTPEQIPVTVGEKLRIHLTNIETAENATHTFAVPNHNLQATLDPGETVSVEFTADRVGSFAFYCAQFCSAMHMEMYGWLLVAPAGA
ncbi:Sec-dependent nitrous-oxide reductase [Cryobacterium sp. TMT1-62]|uniref:Sec-dependent nitrous-oxide reductase n=1 Tax=Cryobacterium sp. TMT1-62 TaxID=1259240 RepID=UPI0010691047|nr:Sec-dependent nitrous-oxide reductase [Cryobacterium sp. TMT1-62]TFD36329.1 Sec-dependent nitrous-oxide reductase [Cryobacterium sp. TMT1-62]